MPDPSSPADSLSDDALAERLADLWIERAATDRRLRLQARRAAGLDPEPSALTVSQLADLHGTDRDTLNRIAARALRKLRLSPELQAIREVDG